MLCVPIFTMCDVTHLLRTTGTECDGPDDIDGVPTFTIECDHGKCKKEGTADVWCECDYPYENGSSSSNDELCDERADQEAGIIVYVTSDEDDRDLACQDEFDELDLDVDLVDDHEVVYIDISHGECNQDSLKRMAERKSNGGSNRSKRSKRNLHTLRGRRLTSSSPSWSESQSSWDDEDTKSLLVLKMSESNARSFGCDEDIHDLLYEIEDTNPRKFYRVAGTHYCDIADCTMAALMQCFDDL